MKMKIIKFRQQKMESKELLFAYLVFAARLDASHVLKRIMSATQRVNN